MTGERVKGGDFWARRKAAVAAEARAETAARLETEKAEREAAVADRSDEELLADLGLPDPDSLDAGDDFKAFLTDAVPARLRMRALRRLWRVNPVLANLDGLVDYGQDFTDSAMVVENMQTAYQVGKGMLRHVEELARQAEPEPQRDDAEQPEDIDTEEPVAAEVPEAVALAEPAEPEATEAQPLDAGTEPAGFAPRRRMTFHYKDQMTG
ncbi:DUF3306 domain-containing protein [Thalassococcus sp. CAU 1522]|uniref:DUF3306 domain-containing protein n=1 Tax=Thalassococcus arenae TaxID=2851652 RepID=A0ABS6N6Y5_9RHOB|nr:DUF3306 domain-containing protein [Thalassococcus arenae]MBV2359432.1 DUF3306 domain-containing protein [Thalassococcus arenae]